MLVDKLTLSSGTIYACNRSDGDRNVSQMTSMGDGWYAVTRERLLHYEGTARREHWNVPVLVNGYTSAESFVYDYMLED